MKSLPQVAWKPISVTILIPSFFRQVLGSIILIRNHELKVWKLLLPNRYGQRVLQALVGRGWAVSKHSPLCKVERLERWKKCSYREDVEDDETYVVFLKIRCSFIFTKWTALHFLLLRFHSSAMTLKNPRYRRYEASKGFLFERLLSGIPYHVWSFEDWATYIDIPEIQRMDIKKCPASKELPCPNQCWYTLLHSSIIPPRL